MNLLSTRHADLAIVDAQRQAVIVMQKNTHRYSYTNATGIQLFDQHGTRHAHVRNGNSGGGGQICDEKGIRCKRSQGIHAEQDEQHCELFTVHSFSPGIPRQWQQAASAARPGADARWRTA